MNSDDTKSAAATDGAEFSLSLGQSSLWFLNELSPESGAYNGNFTWEVNDTLDVEKLKEAIGKITSMHPMLRTSFTGSENTIKQIVHSRRNPSVEILNATNWNKNKIQDFIRKETFAPFDFERESLCRWVIIEVAESHFYISLTIHHMISDLWSIMILINDLKTVYGSLNSGKPISIAEPEDTYSSFVDSQHYKIKEGKWSDSLKFWRSKFEGELPILDLPVDEPNRSPLDYNIATTSLDIGSDDLKQLQIISMKEGATPYVLFLALYFVFLYRYTNQNEILIGSPVAGRVRGAFKRVIGYFVNTVVVKAELERNSEFNKFLKEVLSEVKLVRDHQEVPFPYLVDKLNLVRESGVPTIFQTLFSWEEPNSFENSSNPIISCNESGDEIWDMGSFRMKMVNKLIPNEFDLSLRIVNLKTRLRLFFDYNSNVFTPSTIKRMALSFRSLARSVISHREEKIGRLSLFDNQQEILALTTKNSLKKELEYKTFLAVFQGVIEQFGEQTAVSYHDKSLSYNALNVESQRLAEFLLKKGIQKGMIVGLCMERCHDLIISLLAIWKVGGVYLPLDPSYPAERLNFMIEDSSAQYVITKEDHIENLQSSKVDLITIDTIDRASIDSDVLDPFSRIQHLDGSDAAYVIYTSGSTGKPKGVLLEHKGLANVVESKIRLLGVNHKHRILQVASLNFDASLAEIVMALGTGAHLVLEDSEKILPGPDLLKTLIKRQITHITITPSALEYLPEDEIPDLEMIIVAGEQLSKDLANRWYSRCRLINNYGPTEATIWASYAEISDIEKPITIGRPILNTTIHVLDEDLNPVPIGVKGELCIGGIGLAREYINLSEKTSASFVKNPFNNDAADLLYKSGDIARLLEDGSIECFGRNDHQVKIRGYRIEIGELTTVIKQYPGIQSCLAIPSKDKFGLNRLIAYLIVQDKKSFSLDRLKLFMKSKLPDFMIPAAFVLMDEFPMNLSGKTDITALPTPDSETSVGNKQSKQAKSTVELELKDIWKHVLSRDEIGISDNFFDLGGNSLLMLQVYKRLPKHIKKPTNVVDLFEYPTIQSFAEFCSDFQSDVKKIDKEITEKAESLPRNNRDIAIIAMVGRFPGADSVEELWQNLLGGVESITHFSEEELLAAEVNREDLIHPDYVKAKGVMRAPELFDSHFFGFNPKLADYTDPQQRLFLECSWEALELAGYDPSRYPGKIGVFGGSGFNSYRFGLEENTTSLNSTGDFPIMIGNEKDFLCTRVAYKLNLKGPAVVTQTACSTSLVAVHSACKSLNHLECDMALAGGVSVIGTTCEGYFYEKGGILSPDGHCRPFDALGQGTVPGQGVGLVVLKRLEDAIQDGDTIHAIIKGTATNNDGSMKAGYTAPGVEGQVNVIREALEVAGVDPNTIRYIESHGTGTPLGDPIEIRALSKVYGESRPQTGDCAIGAVKSNLGHLDAAAGVTGLIKTALTLKNKQLVPLANFENPNPGIDFENSPFFITDRLRDFTSNGYPLRAGVSSFGIGGTNAHAILEEAPLRPDLKEAAAWHILPLSAKTQGSLQRTVNNLLEFLMAEKQPAYRMTDIAHTLQNGRQEFNHRCIVMCKDREDAIDVLANKDPVQMTFSQTTASSRPVAFMFPGQGAQYVDMGRDLYENEPLFKKEMDQCIEILLDQSGLDIKKVIYPDPGQIEDAARNIIQTVYTQPVLFAIEYATARLWIAYGVEPQCMIGHSIGEYTAACMAGVMSLEEALRLVAERGRLIQALPGGAMLSVRLSEQEVRPFLTKGLSLAAVNTPNRCVLAGETNAINSVQKDLKDAGKDCVILHTSHAFHSHMLEPVLQDFKKAVLKVQFKEPSIPYISNVTGDWIKSEQVLNPDYWLDHLRGTVQFSSGIKQILRKPDIALLEVGPGRVLRTLSVQNLEKTKDHVAVSSIRHLTSRHSDREYILASLGRLWLHGVKINWEKLNSSTKRYRVPLPTYPFERRRHWISKENKPTLSTAKIPNLGDWFYLPTWKQTYHSHRFSDKIDLPYAMKWLVFVDRMGFGKRIAESLRENDQQVIEISMGSQFRRIENHWYQINPNQAADYEELANVLQARGYIPQKIMHLWSLIGQEYWGLEYFNSLQEVGFYSLINLIKAFEVADLKRLMQIQVVSDNMQEVQGNEQLSPGKATILALVNTLHLEYPHLYCQSADISIPDANSKEADDLIPRLIREIGLFGDDRIIAYRNEYRWVQAFEKRYCEPISQNAIQLKRGGVYLITGGLGSIGLMVAEYLAKTVMAKIALLGRSPFPQKSDWQKCIELNSESESILNKIEQLKQMERYGAQILVLEADVSNENQMETAVERIEEHFGQINGVFHAAGDIGDQTFHKINKLNPDVCERQFNPKVNGAFVLENIFKNKQVSFIMMFSSLSCITGGVDFTAYAAANHFLDCFAKLLDRYSPIRWITVNWDGWKTKDDQDLYFLMSREEGVEVLHRILSQNFTTQLIISTIDLYNRLSRLKSKSVLLSAEREPTQNISLPLTAASEEETYVAPRNDIEHKISQIWQEFLDIERISIHEDFFELGGDSLMAVRLIAKLGEVFPGAVTEKSILEESTIAGFSKAVQCRLDLQESSIASQQLDHFESLIQIQKGDPAKRRLFLVHPGGGFVFNYIALAKNLKNSQPLYAFQSRGIKDISKLLHSVEEMADFYLSEMISLQPTGPYLLGGASFGGLVAYEMAGKLLKKEKEVDLLVLIDTPGPNTAHEGSFQSDAEIAFLLFGRSLPLEKSTFESLGSEELVNYIVTTNNSIDTGYELSEDFVKNCIDIAKTHLKAMKAYVAKPYAKEILFFKHTEALPEYSLHPERDWIDLAEHGVTVIKIPGNHYTMNLEPNVKSIATALTKKLGE